MSEKIAKLKTIIYQGNKIQNNNPNIQVKETIRADALEIARIERNMYEKIQANERYTRNLLISILGVIIAFIGLFSLFDIKYFVSKIAEAAFIPT